MFGGEGGIRTHGRFPYAGFQDQYLKPLGHLANIIIYSSNRTGIDIHIHIGHSFP